jgi:hypothetical protein
MPAQKRKHPTGKSVWVKKTKTAKGHWRAKPVKSKRTPYSKQIDQVEKAIRMAQRYGASRFSAYEEDEYSDFSESFVVKKTKLGYTITGDVNWHDVYINKRTGKSDYRTSYNTLRDIARSHVQEATYEFDDKPSGEPALSFTNPRRYKSIKKR